MAYLKKLVEFNARDTQFVPGAGRKPIPAAPWREYKKLERDHNKMIDKHMEKIGGTMLPTGMTVEESERYMRPTRFERSVANRPFEKLGRTSYGLKSVKDIRRITKMLERKTSPGYLDRELKRSAKQAGKLLSAAGHNQKSIEVRPGVFETPKEAMKRLTPEQFDLLWNYNPGFAEAAKYIYSDYDDAGGYQDDIKEYLEWALTV